MFTFLDWLRRAYLHSGYLGRLLALAWQHHRWILRKLKEGGFTTKTYLEIAKFLLQQL